MGSKFVIYFCLFVGSSIGSYLPTLWHQDMFSFQSIIGSAIGGIIGVWVGFKINQMIEG
jgi:uncharacterized membrane protein YeaQ/YmgE (transglycosylase-associated protein family)